MNQGHSKHEATLQAATELLDLLENESPSAERVLMKAMRVARLLGDGNARKWLVMEQRGYPIEFDATKLGWCKTFLDQSGRRVIGHFYSESLPAIEAAIDTNKQILNKSRGGGSISMSVMSTRDPLEKLGNKITHLQQRASAIRGGIHSFATDVSIALDFGRRVASIFDHARDSADKFLSNHCPHALEQLRSVEDRLGEQNAESLSQAMLTCRRLLMTVADVVFPASKDSYVDSSGTPRAVGNDEYKNRLLAFVEQRLKKDVDQTLVRVDMQHLAARLDRLYENTCKGTHASVSVSEVRQTIIHTYLFLAEIAESV